MSHEENLQAPAGNYASILFVTTLGTFGVWDIWGTNPVDVLIGLTMSTDLSLLVLLTTLPMLWIVRYLEGRYRWSWMHYLLESISQWKLVLWFTNMCFTAPFVSAAAFTICHLMILLKHGQALPSWHAFTFFTFLYLGTQYFTMGVILRNVRDQEITEAKEAGEL